MRSRLVAAFVLVLAIVLLAQNVPLVSYLRDVETDRQRTGLQRDAFIIAGRAEELLDAGTASGDDGLQALVDRYRAAEGHRVVVVDRFGSAVVISDESAATGSDYSTRPEIGRALTGDVAAGERYSDTLELELVYVAVPVFSGDDVVGAVRLTSPSSEIDDLVDRRVRGIVLVVIVALALGVVVALVLAQGISRPLRSLQRSTNRLAAGDLTTRADVDKGPVEVRELASAFDRMSSRLQSLVEAQRSFASDASHQLRTPLTALRLQVEQALQLVESDPFRARDQLERTSSEIDRLQHLIDGLLVLARLENSSSHLEDTDASKVITQRVDVWAPLAEERGGTITVNVDAPTLIALMPGTLEQIVDNLVDNAINASDGPPDIEVSLTSEPMRSAAVLRVADRGRGLPPDEMSRAFDRFWRSATNSSSGSGIGLAIVRRLVEVNDGSVTMSARDGGGISVKIEFPWIPPRS